MKKTIKLLAITIIFAMLMLFTIVDAAASKTEKIVEALEELAKSYDGTVNYEGYKIEIEWNTPNSKSNEIVFSYNGNEELFEETFGYPMYTTIDGKKVLNSSELLLDMYTYINSDLNGGTLFNIDSNGVHINDLVTKNQIYLS